VALVLAVCADRVPAAVVIELRDPRRSAVVRRSKANTLDSGARRGSSWNTNVHVTSLSGVLDVSHRRRHVSHVNELRVKSCAQYGVGAGVDGVDDVS
jgi:hypothetical protein